MGIGSKTHDSQMLSYRVSRWHEPLECSGCGAVETGMDATGWKARAVEFSDPGRSPRIVFYCRACAELELGDD
jgi:hypothetical protein